MNFLLFFSDGLHLVEKGNLKLGKSILKAIDSNSNANLYKNAVCFNLNECDFPPLPSPATRSKPPYAPVNMAVQFVNLSVIYLLKSMNLIVQLSYLLILYLSQFLKLRFDLFHQNLKLPLLLRLLFLLIKNVHLLPLLGLVTHQILFVLVLSLLQLFLYHHLRTVTKLLQSFAYLPLLLIVLLML